jgi:hypothetical protein
VARVVGVYGAKDVPGQRLPGGKRVWEAQRSKRIQSSTTLRRSTEFAIARRDGVLRMSLAALGRR